MLPLPASSEELISFLSIPGDLPPESKAIIWKAFTFAKERHAGQIRESGAPAITHVLDVARIIVDYKLDVEAICAALLHDTLEDTATKSDELAQLFGHTIASLVDGVTRLSKQESEGMSKPQLDAKNLRKLFVAMVTDPRVAVIRLADRLHNMRTIAALTAL